MKYLDGWTNSLKHYLKKCMKNSEENVDVDIERVRCSCWLIGVFSFINYRMSWHLSSRKRWIMCLNISLAEEAWLLMIVWGGKLSTDSPGCYCTFCLLGACFSNVQLTFVPADILKDIRKSCSAGFFLKTSVSFVSLTCNFTIWVSKANPAAK